jgi:probable phosphomutase (TIGR03848 family)
MAPRPTLPLPTLVLFVRHGRTPTTDAVVPGRARGLHLSDDGRKQAMTVADHLAGLDNVDAVYASPLERAKETAAPIAKALGLRVRTDRGLLEADCGEWTGRSLKDLRKLPEWRTVQRYPSGFRFPGGESFGEMQARMAGAVARMRDRHPGRTVVAVSHADPIKAAVVDALGMHLDHFQRVVVLPCSVTAVLYSGDGPVVLGINVVGDLGDLRSR